MPQPRPTPLLGFKTPYVKAGEVVLPVCCGCGVEAELTASPAMWGRIIAAVEPRLLARSPHAAAQASAASTRPPILKSGDRLL